MTKIIGSSFVLTALLALTGCAGNGSGPGSNCVGAKCDDPGSARDRECELKCEGDEDCLSACFTDMALELCTLRRNDALESSQVGFTRDHVRWAAADVEGVNTNGGDDRGQEYTEYFAIVQPPAEVEGGELGNAVVLGKPTGRMIEFDDNGDLTRNETTTTPLGIELTEDQLFYLEDHPTEVVGQCVFTSWHQDVPGPLACEADGNCGDILGYKITENIEINRFDGDRRVTDQVDEPLFRMVVGFNSNLAASDLVAQCAQPGEEGDADEPNDPLHDDFIRGCMMTSKTGITGFGTEWRRSDSQICAASMRLAECGCGVDTDADGVADITDALQLGAALVPPQPNADGSVSLRGFPLGTWSGANELPTGCSYVDVDGGSQTLVTCELNASDLLARPGDPKGTCRDKYGMNVVTHVPVPADLIVCTPPEDGTYTGSCTDTPWTFDDR